MLTLCSSKVSRGADDASSQEYLFSLSSGTCSSAGCQPASVCGGRTLGRGSRRSVPRHTAPTGSRRNSRQGRLRYPLNTRCRGRQHSGRSIHPCRDGAVEAPPPGAGSDCRRRFPERQAIQFLMRILIKHVLASTEPKEALVVKGWVRTRRDAKGFSFLELNDGSCLANLQVVVDAGTPGSEDLTHFTTGASVVVEGKLVPSPASGQ